MFAFSHCIHTGRYNYACRAAINYDHYLRAGPNEKATHHRSPPMLTSSSHLVIPTKLTRYTAKRSPSFLLAMKGYATSTTVCFRQINLGMLIWNRINLQVHALLISRGTFTPRIFQLPPDLSGLSAHAIIGLRVVGPLAPQRSPSQTDDLLRGWNVVPEQAVA